MGTGGPTGGCYISGTNTQTTCATLGAGQSVDVQLGGVNVSGSTVPSPGAAAAAVNVTATDHSGAESFLTLYPAGTARPLVSNVNFVGLTTPNRAVVRLGANGRVTIYNNLGGTDVIIDVNGYYTDATTSATTGAYNALFPDRIMDTRGAPFGPFGTCNGGSCTTLGPGSSLVLQVAGQAGENGSGGVPAMNSANPPKAVVLNVAETNDVGNDSFLTIYPSSATRPLASDLNFVQGETRANLVLVQLSPQGTVIMYNNLGSVDVIVDVEAWFG